MLEKKVMNKLLMDENLTVEDVTMADIKMQKLYLERDRVYMIAQAATYAFFSFLLVGMVGLMKGLFILEQFFALLFMGVIILLIASYPYMKSLMDEKKFLDILEEKLNDQKVRITRKHIHSKRK